jgi:hypothetical protein
MENSDYKSILRETYDTFKSMQLSILGNGFGEVENDPELFHTYVESLTQGASADDAAVMSQLMANTNKQQLLAESVSGITPIASMSMPVIRKLWPRFALKNAIKTQVADSPYLTVSYLKPYFEDKDGNRVELPKGLIGAAGQNTLGNATVADANQALKDYTEATFDETKIGLGAKLLTGSDGKAVTNLDRGTKLYSIGVGDTAIDKTVVLNKILGTDGSSVVTVTSKDGTKTYKLAVNVDFAKGLVDMGWIGTAPAKCRIVFRVHQSTEFNDSGYSLMFETKRINIAIPTGTHLNAPITIEQLQDMQALYKIDQTAEVIDTMTNVFATKVDQDVLDFLENEFLNQPSVDEFDSTVYKATNFSFTFDCIPAAGFAGSPKLWREELKPLIDHVAQLIKQASYFQIGTFSIVGNPIDTALISNVNWEFRGGQGQTVDGVSVDYELGTYVGNGSNFKIISSPLVPQGGLYLVFLPDAEDQMTYKYYPYTFSTERGYRDPNHPYVPSIMMTKRHAFQAFTPAIGLIVVKNNSNPGYLAGHWTAVTSPADIA